MITATYRFQLHAGFGFDQARARVAYLDALGISHAYTSPYFTAVEGSTHGYDLVDPKRINPEIGTDEQHRAFLDALKARRMGNVVDFVPNHMAASTKNLWWHDVLENGQASLYADHFDIEWNPPKEALRGKVLLPVLGAQYGEVLEKGELRLKRTGGAFAVSYWERDFPVDPASVAPVLARVLERLDLPADDARRQDLESVASGLARLSSEEPRDRAREKEVLRRRLEAILDDGIVAQALDAAIESVNASPDDLDLLLVAQNYRLAYWRVATEEINYRRFFEINDLAAIRMEHDPVFADMHERLLGLVKDGGIDGVRLDHVDGLYDPRGYFEKLRASLPGKPWIVAEKILSHNELIPGTWAIDGTTGYDFLAAVNGLFVDPRAEEAITALYRDFTGDARAFADHVLEAKRAVLRGSLASELHMLALRLERNAMRDRRSRDFTYATLRRVISETIAAFPVYRTYVRPDGTREPMDVKIVSRAIRAARRRNPEISPSAFAFLKDQLLFDGDDRERAELAMRFQQLTGPVTAKGVEDTSFYTYVRFVALNEVGGGPERFGTTLEAFHALNREHATHTPRTMTSTSTHDTKRGEDVRARLAVLSEMPSAWAQWVREWGAIGAKYARAIDEAEVDEDAAPPSVVDPQPRSDAAPSPSDQLLFFQTVLGAWTPEGFGTRISEYMLKAAREAKQRTSWLVPDETYENALREYCERMLADAQFTSSVAEKSALIATYGASNGLAQALVKIASPGIPDTYQGSETWDLRLVDPDNRTPVDYDRLERDLRSLEGAPPSALRESWADGRVKLFVVSRALRARRAAPELFVDGTYHPVDAGEEIVAFTRGDGVFCAATRFPYRICSGSKAPWAVGDVWGTRTIAVPPGRWRDVLGDRRLDVKAATRVADVFRDLPVALLVRD